MGQQDGHQRTAACGGINTWAQWARLVEIDLEALESYGQAVATPMDQMLVSLTDTELTCRVHTPFGESTVQFLISGAIIGQTYNHTGETSCLKRLEGVKGYRI